MNDDLKARLRSDSYAKPSFPIDARDAMLRAADHIAKLEQQLYEARNSAYRKTHRSYENEARAEAAEAECGRLRAALTQIEALNPDVPANTVSRDALAGIADLMSGVARTALAADQPLEQQGYAARGEPLDDQKSEREDGIADVSWERQLERTCDGAWNAALEAIATEADTVASAAHASSGHSYQAFGECVAATDLTAAARNLKRDTTP